jgi:transposase
MKSYSEDLRCKIVAAVERGMPETHSARFFDVSLSSVKRYVSMARQGNSLAQKKETWQGSKGRREDEKLLNKDIQERLAATIAERIGFI